MTRNLICRHIECLFRLFPLLGAFSLLGLSLCSCANRAVDSRDVDAILADARPGERVDFEMDIRPVLEGRCLPCHSGEQPAGGVSLETQDALYAFGDRGPFIVPNEPLRSRLFRVVILSDSEAGAMPPTGHALSVGEIKLLRNWIRQGAEWGKDDAARLRPEAGAEPRSI